MAWVALIGLGFIAAVITMAAHIPFYALWLSNLFSGSGAVAD